jgi:hypothetical protein
METRRNVARLYRREIREEIGVANHDFVFDPDDEEIVAVKFVTKQEFLELPFMESEALVRQYADQIWATH